LRAVILQPVSGWHGEASVYNLSLGGAGVTLPEALPEGEHLAVSFLAPSLWDPLTIPARIAWVHPATPHEPTTAGLAFEPKDPLSVFALFELVSTLT
jgi:PilZ domain-containing protein